jgi:hypothetical protein
MPEAPERLPEWAEKHPYTPNAYLVDSDKFYPALGKAIFPKTAPDKLDQYQMEVIYQCMKLDMQTHLMRFNFRIIVRADDGRKDRWRHDKRPKGLGAAAASKGNEARAHYRRMRGFIPS